MYVAWGQNAVSHRYCSSTPHTGRPTEAREFCYVERSPGREVSELRRQRRGKWTGLFDAFERGVT